MSLGNFYKNAEKLVMTDLITYHHKNNKMNKLNVLNIYFSNKRHISEKPIVMNCFNDRLLMDKLCYIMLVDLSIDEDPKTFFKNIGEYQKSLNGKTFDIVNCRFSIKNFMTSIRELLIFVKFISDILNDKGLFTGFLLDLNKLNGIFSEKSSIHSGTYGIEYASQNDISDNTSSMLLLINGEKMNIVDFSTLDDICEKCDLYHLDNIILESLYYNSLSEIKLTTSEKQFGFLNFVFIFQKRDFYKKINIYDTISTNTNSDYSKSSISSNSGKYNSYAKEGFDTSYTDNTYSKDFDSSSSISKY